MKLLSTLLPRAACLAFLLTPLAARAQAPAQAPSNFDAVAKHLETGGVFYTLVDIDGDLARFAGLGDGLLDLAKKEAGGALPPGLSATGILKSLGLDRLKAFGMSSKPGTENLFHNRALAYLPEGRSGIFKLLGGAAAPLQSPALAPAGSDLVMESELTLSALLEIAEALLRSTGDESMLQQYRGALAFPMPGGLEMTAGDFIAKLNTRIILAGRLEKGKSFTPHGEEYTVPGFRVVVSFDNLGFLADPILTYAKHSTGVVVEKGEGFNIIKLKEKGPDQPDFLQPLFYHDVKSSRLLLATHPDAIPEFLSNENRISGDSAFVKAITGLPIKANELSYLTPAIYQALEQFVKEAVKAAPATSGAPDPAVLQQMLGFLNQIAPTPTQPVVSLRANLPEGMLFLSNTTSSFKSILTIPAMLATGMIAAVGTGAYESLRHSAKDKINDAAGEEEPVENDDATAAVRNNLQQIAFAAQSYFVDHAQSSEVSYEQLIEAELLFRLEPSAGESYQGLKLKKSGGTLSLKMPHSGTVTQKYGPVTE